MSYCYIKFLPSDKESLSRLVRFYEMLKQEKDSTEEPNETRLSTFLSAAEKRYFWDPSEEEREQWQRFWSATAVDVRLSPKMPSPPWYLESLYAALWIGDYDLLDISRENGSYHLNYEPYGFPYGGTDSMIALVECFGHSVIGIDDGTGYTDYEDLRIIWNPQMKYPYQPYAEDSKGHDSGKRPWWKFW